MTDSNDTLQRRFDELRASDRERLPEFDPLLPQADTPAAATRSSKRWLAVPLAALALGLVWLIQTRPAATAPRASTLDEVCAAALAALAGEATSEGDVWRTFTDDLLEPVLGDER